MNIVELKNIEFKYSNSKKSILNIENFILKKKEKIFLFGPSGYGKTTLLEIIAGVLTPDSGEVIVSEQNLAKMSALQRDEFRSNKIGYIFQSFNLIPYLSVTENITLPLYLSATKRLNVTREQELNQVHLLTQKLGIDDLLSQKVSELSIGQQQRVAAARALIGSPELILADEPTSSLDFDHREKFIQLLFKVCADNNISLLFVSHDKTLEGLFDRSVSLKDLKKAKSL